MNSMEEVAKVIVPKALEIVPCRAVIAVAIMHEGCLEVRAWDINPDKEFMDSPKDIKKHAEHLRRLAARCAVEQFALNRNGLLSDSTSYKLDGNTVVTLLLSPWNVDFQSQLVKKMKE